MAQVNEIVTPRSIPLIVGAVYQLIPSMGGQYVVLDSVDKRYAYATGFENHYMDLKVRKYRWPEVVIKMVGRAVNDSALLLTGGQGYVRLLTGERIGIIG